MAERKQRPFRCTCFDKFLDQQKHIYNSSYALASTNMLASSQLCTVRQQQAKSHLSIAGFRSAARPALASKPPRFGLHVAYSSNVSGLLSNLNHFVQGKTHDGKDILVIDAADWEQSFTPVPSSDTWICKNAPKYIAVKLAEWDQRDVRDLPEAKHWLAENLRLQTLAQSTLKAYYTAHGIKQICRVYGCHNTQHMNKDNNIITLKMALSEMEPLHRETSYITLQLPG